jgi:hypothetical protein
MSHPASAALDRIEAVLIFSGRLVGKEMLYKFAGCRAAEDDGPHPMKAIGQAVQQS